MRLSHAVCAIVLGLAVHAPAFAQQCNLSDPTLLKPDLKALPPQDVRVINRGGHRLVIFTTSIANIGAGPLILHGLTVQTPDGPMTQASQEIVRSDGTSCTDIVGTFVFHPSHAHWHFEDFSDYQLRKDDPFTGEIVGESTKVSFCLLDIMQVPGFNTRRQLSESCTSQEATQGISVGYADVYDSLLPDQWIDLDADPAHPVPGGAYFLVNIANPEGRIVESNDSPEANAGVVSVQVPPPLPSRLTPLSPAAPTGLVHPPHPPHAPHGQVVHPSQFTDLPPISRPSNHPTHPKHPPGPHG